MRDEEILRKAVEKAQSNGWKVGWYINPDPASETYLTFIFSHDFAKAFFGESPACGNPICPDCPGIWTHRLQQMVLKENPIKYLAKFL